MASGKPNPTLAGPTIEDDARRKGDLLEYEEFIEVQIERTRRQVKGVELFGAVLLWLAGALVYLLLVALVDHWLIADGLGFWGRVLGLLGFLVGTGAWFVWCLLPPVLGRVNPIYAAQTIEQHEPSLKNSLINFLMLRGQRTTVAPVVFEAIEQRAADDLSHVPVDSVVDRSRVIRLGYALMAVVGLFALYVLLSPKDPLRSVRRMLAPWSNLAAPTRVSIEDVLPGSVKAFHHDVVEVSAVVLGVRDDEEVTLFFTTADGQAVDRPIRMQLPSGGYRYQANLPESAAGLLQNLSYYIAAGDVRTQAYEIDVLTAPAILVEAVEYEFPAYTGFGTRRVERVGDITGIEGTGVVIEAKANRDIEGAFLDFDCNGTRDLTLTVDGRTARTSFELKRTKEGEPEHESYQLVFVDEAGRQNPEPIRHRIDVVSDQAPIVELVLPKEDELEVPLNGAVTIGVRAVDPDFALRSVTLFAERSGDALVREPLLGERHAGEFRGTWLLDLAQVRLLEAGKPALAAGDTIEYWAEARDVRQPLANRSETVRFRLQITSPGSEQEREELLAEAEQQQEEFEQNEPQPNGTPDEPRRPEDRLASRENRPEQENQQESTESPNAGERREEDSRLDPEQDAGEAFDEILKHRQEQQQNSQPKQPPGEEPSPAAKEREQQPPPAGEGGEQPPSAQSQQESGEQSGGGGEGSESQPGEDRAGGQQGDSAEGESGTGEAGAASPNGAAGKQRGQEQRGSPDGQQENNGASGENQGADGKQSISAAKDAETGDAGQREQSESRNPRDGQRGERGEGGDAEASESSGAESADERQEAASERGGQGAQARQQGTPEEKPSAQPDEGEQAEPNGGDPEGVKGESGEGRSQGDGEGSPSPQERSQARDKPTKRPQPSGERDGEGAAPGSPTISPKESDTQGGEEGDRSGGGEDGGGQKADQEGTGGAGQNTAADEGSGAAEGSGDGADSDEAGSKTAADRQTGQAGEGQAGKGGTGQAKEGAAAEGGADGEGAGRPGEGESGGDAATSSNHQSGGRPGESQSGGQPGDDQRVPEPRNASEPGGEEANLDYAREATALALEHLKDQLSRDEVDPELLERLKWSREDLERFVARWERMRAEAGAEGPKGEEARQQLEDSLRELGLRRSGTTLRGGRVTQDDARRMLESHRSRPPSEYADQFKAYTEGMSKGHAKGSR